MIFARHVFFIYQIYLINFNSFPTSLTTATFSLQYNLNLLLHLILPCIVEHKYSAHCYYQG